MGRRQLVLVIASVSLTAAAPIEKQYYEWLAPDATTVLCSSLVPGSCDPYDQYATGQEALLRARTEFLVAPGQVKADTSLSPLIMGLPGSTYYLRLKYSFEDEIDLGWHAFVGGTGDFLAEYRSVGDGHGDLREPLVSFSFSTPFPAPTFTGGEDTFVLRRETFGRPFRLQAHYKFDFQRVLPPEGNCDDCFTSLYFDIGLWAARDPITLQELPSRPLIVAVAAPIPEPAGLSMLGLSAMLITGVARKIALRRLKKA